MTNDMSFKDFVRQDLSENKPLLVKNITIKRIIADCPSCGEKIAGDYYYNDQRPKFCEHCGQALLWPDRKMLNHYIEIGLASSDDFVSEDSKPLSPQSAVQYD